MLHLYVMRHGQTTHSDTLRGSLDDELTNLGFSQMQLAWEHFEHKNYIQGIVSSDLSRCQSFAKKLCQELNLPLLILPDLQEIHFGDWEGKKVIDLYEKFPDELAKFWQTPTQFTPPNAEPFLIFAHRIDSALAQVADYAFQQNLKNILIITHGGVIKLLSCKANLTSYDEVLTYSAELGQIYHFCYDKTNGTITW